MRIPVRLAAAIHAERPAWRPNSAAASRFWKAKTVCEALLKFCRENDVHLVVLGTTERRWWQFTRPNVLNFFLHHAPGIDLHIVDPNR